LGCEESHNIVYVPLSTEMLQRLWQFMFTKDSALLEDVLGQQLVTTIQQYLRAKPLRGSDDLSDM